jgi:hypothetical protein
MESVLKCESSYLLFNTKKYEIFQSTQVQWERFSEKLISDLSVFWSLCWPARHFPSLDLAVINFILWGFVKQRIVLNFFKK